MRTVLLRALLAIIASVVVTGFAAPAGAKVSGSNGESVFGRFDKAAAPGGRSGTSTGSGTQLWAKRYNGPANGSDDAYSVAVSPGGAKTFVTGQSWGGTSNFDYATVAYSTATGTQLWVQRYNDSGNHNDSASAIAVSPGGGQVFVTGDANGTYTTIAYNAATGTQQWVQQYSGVISGTNSASAIAVSPSGGQVFVTGSSFGGATTGYDYATVAYNAATGARQWVQRYNGPANGDDHPSSLAVSSGQVFVTGQSWGGTSNFDYATVAYSTATGAQQWVKRYNSPGNAGDSASAVAVSPSGGQVFVTGQSTGASAGYDYATIAYSSATGAQQWVKRYNGPANLNDSANSLAVSPDGTKVFVTGQSTGASSGYDYATIAYSSATGAQQWVKRYNGPGNRDDTAHSVAASSGGQVVITGQSLGSSGVDDYATVAYSG